MDTKAEPCNFSIELEVEIDAPPNVVFSAFTRDVAAWWGEPYLICPERAIDIVMDPFLGGSFYEVWGGGDGACWAKVTQMRRYEVIELRGPLGMSGAVNGVIRIEFEDLDNGTRVKLRHQAAGYIEDSTEARYIDGWKDLLEKRLRDFVDKGIESGVRRQTIQPGGPCDPPNSE
jgi:uncharacterized protein YndB with AHSA1/START domain